MVVGKKEELGQKSDIKMAMKETETKTNNEIIAKEGYARVKSHSLFSVGCH